MVHRFDATGKAGLNRTEWDLRAPGATTVPGLVLRWASPPPGKYSVRLTSGDVVRTALTVEKDPRLGGVSDAEMLEQYRFAIEIRDKTSVVHAAVVKIRDARASAKSEEVKAALAAVEEELYQVRNRSPWDTLNYPIKLNNQLAVLEMLVEMGNGRPTDQDYAVFEELSARVSEIFGRLDRIWSGLK